VGPDYSGRLRNQSTLQVLGPYQQREMKYSRGKDYLHV
jgi:hypothetical protein